MIILLTSFASRLQLKCDGTRWRAWGEVKGNWRMEWVASTLHTTSEHVVSSITKAVTPTSAASGRLNWHPPADLNGLVRFAERRNLVSARVPSHFNWPLQQYLTHYRTAYCALCRGATFTKGRAQLYIATSDIYCGAVGQHINSENSDIEKLSDFRVCVRSLTFWHRNYFFFKF